MIKTITAAALTATALAVTVLVPAAADAGSCGGAAYATPFKRGPVSESNCGVFGSPGYTIHYSWKVAGGSSGKACLEGWGFDDAHPKGGWFSLGCGTGAVAGVPWGNVLATPKVRGESLAVPLGTPISWRH